jgi:hypothetical protein
VNNTHSKNKSETEALAARAAADSIRALLSLGIEVDASRARRTFTDFVTIPVFQWGWDGLPGARDFYQRTAPHSSKRRYGHVGRFFVIAADSSERSADRR